MPVPNKNRLEQLKALRTLIQTEHDEASREVKSEINVTPLVDVVLVLLIIFMVVTPMIASGVAVDLPVTANHSRKPDDGRDIIISVTNDKRIFVGSQRVDRVEDLGRAVSAERAKSPEKSIFVKGDVRAPYGMMRRVMEGLRGAGFDEVVLGTEELGKKQN